MKRVGRAAEFLAWTLFFAAAAFALVVRFWLLPEIERYRSDIVAAVSRSVGQPVRIGAIQAGWMGLNPHLHLRDVRVDDHAGREVLALPSVENRISWRSFLLGEVRLLGLAIEGLRVQVRRDAEGALHIAGMKLGAGEARFIRWALAQDEIVLRNAEIEWHDELRGAPPLALSSLTLRLRNAGEQHALGFTARPPAALGSTLEVRALLDGNRLAQPASWTGRIYAELGYTDLAGWRAWIDYPWPVERGRGALRAWLTMAQGEVREATADLALSEVSTRLSPDLAPLQLGSVHGRLQGAMEGGRYRLRADDLSVGVGGGAPLKPSDFELRWSAGDGAQGSFEAASLELEPLAALAAALPLPEKVRTLVADMRPRGALAEARAEWRGPGEFAARARFIELAAAPNGAMPGFGGITGSFDADGNGARIVLATRKGELFLPRVLPEPRVALDVLNGLVEVERRGDGFFLRLSSLSFANAHASGTASGSYEKAREGPGRIDLSADLARADASQLARYLPHAALMGGEGARAWLVRAVQAGQASSVRVRIRGDLRDFPFSEPKLGQFSVSARIERAAVQFAEGWPRIDDVHGELVFERERMRLHARSASTLGIALAEVDVTIPQLLQPPRELHVTGRAEGSTADFLRYVHASPVQRRTAGLTEAMSASGPGTLRLKLEIPFADPAAARVAGEYQFKENELTVHAQLPPIEAARGKLAFNEAAFHVEGVEGRLFGGPVSVRGESLAEGGMQIVAKGEASVAGTRALFDHPWRRYLGGQAGYVATVHAGKGRPSIVVRSSLQGVTSTLPAPLAKRAGESVPLQLEFGPEQPTRLRLGRIVAAEFLRDRAAVALTPGANAPLKLPSQPGSALYGSLPALDLDKWLPLIGGFESASAAQATTFDVRIGALDLYGKRVNEAALRGTVEAAGWAAVVSSQELAGDLSYRGADGGKLVARLTRFRTPEPSPGAAPRSSVEPKSLPSMDLVAERFTLRGKDLGRVEIHGSRAGDDWRIEKLTMTNAEAQLAASGVWRSGAPTLSDLQFELNATDAGLFLGRVGYPGLVKGGAAHLKGALAWHGEPSLIDYASLTGSIHLQAKSGQFLEIEPGIGKLVSLMSLQSLPRRITLDFRDVFSKGFGFEEIRSSGQVRSGVMTVKDFRMQGSSAQVEMSGEVDLAQETQNMRVRVVPSLGDTASTVIALVNPLLAIPAAIAQKILKDPLGHIFAFDYAVTGGWSDPKVAKIGVEARELNPGASSP